VVTLYITFAGGDENDFKENGNLSSTKPVKINFVDLAGSERHSRQRHESSQSPISYPTMPLSSTRGSMTSRIVDHHQHEKHLTARRILMREEAKAINQSLLALGHVIDVLAHSSTTSSKQRSESMSTVRTRILRPLHGSGDSIDDEPVKVSLTSQRRNRSSSNCKSRVFVPFRNSRLTTLLSESLGLNDSSHCLIVICVDESPVRTDESLQSLMFGVKAMRVKAGGPPIVSHLHSIKVTKPKKVPAVTKDRKKVQAEEAVIEHAVSKPRPTQRRNKPQVNYGQEHGPISRSPSSSPNCSHVDGANETRMCSSDDEHAGKRDDEERKQNLQPVSERSQKVEKKFKLPKRMPFSPSRLEPSVNDILIENLMNDIRKLRAERREAEG
jgi:hypothetical protein